MLATRMLSSSERAATISCSHKRSPGVNIYPLGSIAHAVLTLILDSAKRNFRIPRNSIPSGLWFRALRKDRSSGPSIVLAEVSNTVSREPSVNQRGDRGPDIRMQ